VAVEGGEYFGSENKIKCHLIDKNVGWGFFILFSEEKEDSLTRRDVVNGKIHAKIN
jgi:hypothetical protein